MATPQNNQPDPSQNPGTAGDPTNVGRLEKEHLAWSNILRVKKQIKKATQDEETIRKQMLKLQKDEAKNAAEYKKSINAVKQLEKDLQDARVNGNKRGAKALKDQIAMEKDLQKQLQKTTGGALMSLKVRAKATKDALTAEKNLIKDINKERGLGGKIADLFRSKEARQKSIDLARAKVGGGINQGKLASGGVAGKDGGGMGALAMAFGPIGLLIAGIAATVKLLAGAFKALGGAIMKGLTAPLGEAASILGSEKFGIGGGKVSGAGATSMLDGLANIAGAIPFIGGLLGPLIKGFKTILDAVLGINQAQVNFARNQGISLKQAQAIRAQFQQQALASNNIVVNQTRLLEQQAELSQALGVTNIMSASILENDVKLKDIAGIELETRQKIAETSIITGKNAEGLTKELMGQVGAVKAVTGISFNLRGIMAEVGKLSGVIGLQFAKYPGKVTETLLKTKILGFELKSLRDTANSFLDFESSISKEFEAQVLTGKDMNLTRAREAALNNDMATLSAEITKNVGSANDFLNMNRIQQDAIAESVGMTSDALADVLRKQEMYAKLGKNNQKDALAYFNLVNATAEGREKLKTQLGEENYASMTQVSIAEKLAAVMDKIKQTFIDFIEKSKVFEFLTNPEKVNGFIRSVLNGLAGAIDTIGEIFAGVMEAISHLPLTDTTKWQGYANMIRGGAGTFSGGIRSMSGGIGLDEGGVVTQTGMAKVDKGEVYLGANSLSIIKDMVDQQRETNKHLQMIYAKGTKVSIDGREIAVANANNATTIHQGNMS